jgi:hypothetical protein
LAPHLAHSLTCPAEDDPAKVTTAACSRALVWTFDMR